MCDSCGCDSPQPAGSPQGDQPGPDGATTAGRRVEVRRDVLGRNQQHAERNRTLLAQHRIAALNLISSPGAGKTSLLEATIGELKDHLPLAVVEGDLQTERDAARIRTTGVPVHQINTGEGCHLDAHMVGHALEHLPLPEGGVLFIENVGNLVCPASFDLGESRRVVLLSVAEGDDKVEKYPVAFRNATVLVVNKVDLLDYVDFSLQRCREMAHRLNPELVIFEVSARQGTGIREWCQWVQQQTS